MRLASHCLILQTRLLVFSVVWLSQYTTTLTHTITPQQPSNPCHPLPHKQYQRAQQYTDTPGSPLGQLPPPTSHPHGYDHGPQHCESEYSLAPSESLSQTASHRAKKRNQKILDAQARRGNTAEETKFPLLSGEQNQQESWSKIDSRSIMSAHRGQGQSDGGYQPTLPGKQGSNMNFPGISPSRQPRDDASTLATGRRPGLDRESSAVATSRRGGTKIDGEYYNKGLSQSARLQSVRSGNPQPQYPKERYDRAPSYLPQREPPVRSLHQRPGSEPTVQGSEQYNNPLGMQGYISSTGQRQGGYSESDGYCPASWATPEITEYSPMDEEASAMDRMTIGVRSLARRGVEMGSTTTGAIEGPL